MNPKPAWLPEITENTKQTWRPARADFSAGGVVYRRAVDGSLDLALIATHGTARWQLPKGSREVGETALQTALREVEEEVGLQTASEAYLQQIDYWYWDTYRKEPAELVHKHVDFFLLRAVSGELSDASYEVDAVGWFTPAQALAQLTFGSERSVVERALHELDNG